MATQQARFVIDQLAVVFDAAATLDGVRVAKGWQILPTGEQEHVFVASDGGVVLGNEDIVRAQIEWPGLGPSSRTESGVIDCAASVWTGDENAVDASITRAYVLVGACEDVLRADPSLGAAVALQAKIVETRLQVVQDAEGFAAIVVFTVAYMVSI